MYTSHYFVNTTPCTQNKQLNIVLTPQNSKQMFQTNARLTAGTVALLSQRQPSPFQDAAAPPDTAKYTRTVAPQKERYWACDLTVAVSSISQSRTSPKRPAQRQIQSYNILKVLQVLRMCCAPVTALSRTVCFASQPHGDRTRLFSSSCDVQFQFPPCPVRVLARLLATAI
jgi:hypothetical protein